MPTICPHLKHTQSCNSFDMSSNKQRSTVLTLWYSQPGMGEEDRGGLPDLDPKSRSGFFNLPDHNLDPTRPDFCQDIIPLEISRPYLLPTCEPFGQPQIVCNWRFHALGGLKAKIFVNLVTFCTYNYMILLNLLVKTSSGLNFRQIVCKICFIWLN